MKRRGPSQPSSGDGKRKGTQANSRTLDARVDDHVAFFESFLREPASVGAVVPSSPALAKAMIAGFDLENADTVVELGPGTGAFTAPILQGIGRRTTFIALELDEHHVSRLKKKFPDAAIYNDSAANLHGYLSRHGKRRADYIVSGLPWASIPLKEQGRIMDAILASLAPGGMFTTFGYFHTRLLPSSKRFCRRLEQEFALVERSKLVWRNIPPAYVYRCTLSKEPRSAQGAR